MPITYANPPVHVQLRGKKPCNPVSTPVLANACSRQRPFSPTPVLANHCSILLAICLASITPAHAALEPYEPLTSPPVTVTPLSNGTTGGVDATEEYKLIVKFVNAAEARVDKGQLISMSGLDLTDADALAAAESAGYKQILTGSSCPALDTMIAAAEQNSGREQPDLKGIHEVVFSQARTAQEMADLGNALLAEPEVEYALLRSNEFAPPPNLKGGTTPDLVPEQTYLLPDPGGDYEYAHAVGIRGFGVRVSEVSVTYDDDHEDLENAGIDDELIPVDLNQDPGDLFGPGVTLEDWWNHGSATMGMVLGVDNGFGIKGMAFAASGHFYPSAHANAPVDPLTDRLLEATCNALVDSANAPAPNHFGSVVYFEHQSDGTGPGDGGAPIETESMEIFNLIQAGTDAGVIVLEPAGNGPIGSANNLDDPMWDYWRQWGDSGAIIVGGGTADTEHHLCCFSSRGERVNVQGWAQPVTVASGYGDRFEDPDDMHTRYTATFGGTSGATPMAASAAVLVQNRANALGLTRLGPREMRHYLATTGIPQGGDPGFDGNIGPFVDVRAALEQIDRADLAIQTHQDFDNPVTTEIENLGPRFAQDVTATIEYSSATTYTIANIPSNCSIVADPGLPCPGQCPTEIECNFAEVRTDTPVSVEVEFCPSGGQAATLTVSSSLSVGGGLNDPDSNNDDATDQFSVEACGPTS